jgi:hypothetical protein
MMDAAVIVALILFNWHLVSIAFDVAAIKGYVKDMARRADDGK